MLLCTPAHPPKDTIIYNYTKDTLMHTHTLSLVHTRAQLYTEMRLYPI